MNSNRPKGPKFYIHKKNTPQDFFRVTLAVEGSIFS